MKARRTMGTRWLVTLGIAAVAALTMGANDDGCGNGKLPPGLDQDPECKVAADCFGLDTPACEGAWTCDEGTCAWKCDGVEPACASDADCPGGACVDGVCQSIEPPECSADVACPAGQACVDGSCVPVEDPCALIDCAPGFACEEGTCVPVGPTDCMPTGCSGEICAAVPIASDCVYEPWMACLELTECGNYGPSGTCGWLLTDAFQACLDALEPPEGCTSDADCAPGEVCACTPDPNCPECDVCLFQCVPQEPEGCQTDADCGPGEVCLMPPCARCDCPPDGADCYCPPCVGQCVPKQPEGCSTDADCAPGEVCACTPDPNCPACDVCLFQCVPKEPEGCQSDADCAPGEFCAYPPCAACDCAPGMDNCWCPPCVGICMPKVEPDVCYGDQDCPAGTTCNAAEVCLPPPGCKPGAPCPAVCTGWCVPDEPQLCEVDSDCPPGEVCTDIVCPACDCFAPGDPSDPSGGAEAPCWCGPCQGVCAPKEEPPPGACLDDADCGPGEYCKPQPCPLAPCTPDWCPPCYGVCAPKVPPPDDMLCLADADCPAGYQCNTELCLPPPGCAPGDICPAVCYGLCEPVDPTVICETDADCPAGQICQPGGCDPCTCDASGVCKCPPCLPNLCVDPTPTDECKSDLDCPAGESCQCVPPFSMANALIYCVFQCVPDAPPACASDADCLKGEVCMDGWCVQGPPQYDCHQDADCGEGAYCDIQMCTGCACPADDPTCVCDEPVCYGFCTPGEPPPPPCQSDADCPEGQVCELYGFADPAVPCSPEWCPPPPVWGMCVDAPPPSECVVSGCSGQICAPEPMASTCEWLPWYACFKLSECGGYGANGQCGWLETPEFLACMAEYGK